VITGSQIAAVLGMDPHKSALEAWFEITGRRKYGEGAEPPDERRRRRALERHRALERICLEYGTEELETIVGRVAEPVELPYASLPDSPWAQSRPPAAWRVGDELVLGVPKTVSGAEIFHKRWGTERTDQVADAVLVADQWHMLHYPDAHRCLNPVLIGGWKFNFSWWMVEADPELGKILLERAHAWHVEYVEKNQPPPAVPRDDVLLARLYAGRKDQQTQAGPELIELCAQAKRLGAEADRLSHQNDKLRTQIREMLADCTAARWGGDRKVTLSLAKPTKAVHWQGVATDLAAKLPSDLFTETIAKHTYEKLDKRILRITIPGFEDDEG
jgi:hypothetical protein